MFMLPADLHGLGTHLVALVENIAIAVFGKTLAPIILVRMFPSDPDSLGAHLVAFVENIAIAVFGKTLAPIILIGLLVAWALKRVGRGMDNPWDP